MGFFAKLFFAVEIIISAVESVDRCPSVIHFMIFMIFWFVIFGCSSVTSLKIPKFSSTIGFYLSFLAPCAGQPIGDVINFPNSIICGTEVVRPLQNIGAGGSGSVYKGVLSSANLPVAVKVSWVTTFEPVRRECEVLDFLAMKGNARNVEKCIADCEYLVDGQPRKMILLYPFFQSPKTSITSFKNTMEHDITKRAVGNLVESMIQLVGSGVILTDLQYLVDPDTGDLLVIDVSEAQYLRPNDLFSRQQLVASFASEVRMNIPDEYLSDAVRAMDEEIMALRDKSLIDMPDEYVSILRDIFS